MQLRGDFRFAVLDSPAVLCLDDDSRDACVGVFRVVQGEVGFYLGRVFACRRLCLCRIAAVDASAVVDLRRIIAVAGKIHILAVAACDECQQEGCYGKDNGCGKLLGHKKRLCCGVWANIDILPGASEIGFRQDVAEFGPLIEVDGVFELNLRISGLDF